MAELPLMFRWSWRDWPGEHGTDFWTGPHSVGDEKCPACCCGGPGRCQICGGLRHNDMAEFTVSDEPEHTFRCDRPCRCISCAGESDG